MLFKPLVLLLLSPLLLGKTLAWLLPWGWLYQRPAQHIATLQPKEHRMPRLERLPPAQLTALRGQCTYPHSSCHRPLGQSWDSKCKHMVLLSRFGSKYISYSSRKQKLSNTVLMLIYIYTYTCKCNLGNMTPRNISARELEDVGFRLKCTDTVKTCFHDAWTGTSRQTAPWQNYNGKTAPKIQ